MRKKTEKQLLAIQKEISYIFYGTDDIKSLVPEARRDIRRVLSLFE